MTPKWVRGEGDFHAEYRRGEVVATLPVNNWQVWDARGWEFVKVVNDGCGDAVRYATTLYQKAIGYGRLMMFRGNRELIARTGR